MNLSAAKMPENKIIAVSLPELTVGSYEDIYFKQISM